MIVAGVVFTTCSAISYVQLPTCESSIAARRILLVMLVLKCLLNMTVVVSMVVDVADAGSGSEGVTASAVVVSHPKL